MTASLLFYVRHGETEWNQQGRLQGQHDSGLTALGRAQAVHCGEILRQLLARDGRDAGALDFVSSPLGRARATMEVMRAALGLEPVDYRTDARLAELAFGRWEGVAYPELLAHERVTLAAREQDKWNFVPPGAKAMPICWCACAPGMRRCGATAWSSRTAAPHARSWPCVVSRSGKRLRPSPSTRASFTCSLAEALRDTRDGDERQKRRRAIRVPRRSAKKERPDLHIRPPGSASAVANARQAAMR
jgi:broad specificity phosphatase PhoE